MKKRLFFLLIPLVLMLVVSTSVMNVKAVQFQGKDTDTRGNWWEKIGDEWFQHYGRDGYILCGFNTELYTNDDVWAESYDRKHLPSYITGYTVKGTGGAGPLPPGKAGVYTVPPCPTSDESALIDPDILNDPNVLSMRINSHCFTTPYNDPNTLLTVELQFSGEACNKYFHLSLYFLDADQNRKLKVTVSDEEPCGAPQSWSVDLEPSETKTGVYVVFTVYGPTKLEIRLFNGYNCNPCISGIFIDSIAVPPHVIPEVPLGTLSALLACFMPLMLLKKIKGKYASE